MFFGLELEGLQIYWWVILSLLGGFLVFMCFVQGGQTLIDELSKDELEKTMLVNSLGRKWELGFTTLVLFGGAAFAAFPLFIAQVLVGLIGLGFVFYFALFYKLWLMSIVKKKIMFMALKPMKFFLKLMVI